jgi:hypothetical protein
MPEVTLSVGGRLRSSPLARSEHAAFVELEFMPPSRPAAATAGITFVDYDAELELAPGSELPLDALERDEVPNAEPPSRARRERRGSEKLRVALAEIPYLLTPAYVREAVDAALLAQGVAATLARIESLTTRAKTSAMLPEVRLRAGRDVDQSMRLSPTADDPYRYTQTGAVAFVMDGSVTWRLSRLVFASEELSAERLRLAQSRERQRVTAATVNELLVWQLAWRRAAAIGERGTTAAEDLVESTLRLDVMTGGWFSAHQPAGDPLTEATPHASGRGVSLLPEPTSDETRAERRRARRRAPLPRDPGKQNQRISGFQPAQLRFAPSPSAVAEVRGARRTGPVDAAAGVGLTAARRDIP